MDRGVLNAPLDSFLPEFDVRERHATVVAAPAEVVYATAQAFDLQSVRAIRVIIRLRELLLRATPPDRAPEPFLKEALGMGWGLLEEQPGRLFVAGARCQPWLADVQFIPIPPEEFASYCGPDQVKIAWTLEVEPLGPERARLATETRALAMDEASRRRFSRYWRWARFGIVAIRWFMLPAIRRAAQDAWRKAPSRAA